QPQLRQLRERVCVRSVVNPLRKEEMRRYIEHRLQLAGGTVDELFAPRALRLIIRRAAGLPRRANILCHNALLFAFGRSLPPVTGRIAPEGVAEMGGQHTGTRGRRESGGGAGAHTTRWVIASCVVAAALGAVGLLRSSPPSWPPTVSSTDPSATAPPPASPEVEIGTPAGAAPPQVQVQDEQPTGAAVPDEPN